MTFRTLISRGLGFHWRSHLGVVLGAAVGSAALVGALVVGDSVHGSLLDSARARLGIVDVALDAQDRFFRDTLANKCGGEIAAPVLRIRGSTSRSDGEGRANQIQVLGVDERFRTLADSGKAHRSHTATQTELFPVATPDCALINSALAAHLRLKVGDNLILRVAKPSLLAADAAISPKNDLSVAMRLKVTGIWPDDMPLGNFNLQPNQSPPFNVFVPLAYLQQQLDVSNRANLALVSGATLDQANARLCEVWQLADAQVDFVNRAASHSLELHTTRVFLDPQLERVALAVDTNAQPILTYLANLLYAGTNSTPYSMVTAAGAPWTTSDMRDDEILVNQWLAEDLSVTPGGKISLSYFDPESGARLVERTNTFRIRSIVPMEMPWADRTLMPDFPGIEKAKRTHDWDAGFPLVYKIRQKDEEYWKKYRGTPKAFVTLAAGQKMWANRFGNLTAIRFPIPTDSTATDFRVALEKKIFSSLKPEGLGLRFEPVREQALNAAAQSQDFGQLFLGFSIFLIVAALLLMTLLFQFGLEQRTSEIGTLLALGFTPKQVRRLLLGEGVALAFLGGVLGAMSGLVYAKAMLHGLTTVWRDAVGAAILNFHVTTQTLAIGFFASVAVSAATIWLNLRRIVKRPPRALLAGEIRTEESKVQTLKSKVMAVAALLGAIALVGWVVMKGDTANAGIFFGAGSLMLVAGLAIVSDWLRHRAGVTPVSDCLGSPDGDRLDACPTLKSLAVRGCGRRRKRSLATVGMLACGSFLIISIGVFRLDANRDATKRTSSTGGFALIGETTMPVVQDLNSQSGRDFFALSQDALAGVSFVSFRMHEGDEASCLNLNRAQQPRLLGVKPEKLEGRFTFAKGEGWTALKSAIRNPQSVIEIPAIGDANSVQWAMGKKVGDTIDYMDERGQPFKVRIVGAVANSILQGSLIIDESEFVRLFASESGYRMYLIDAPTNGISKVSATLSRAMQDVGLDLTPTAQRLAQFNAVQNTYLGTFQVLGGLGLLLGSVGLGIVVLRNVMECRGELAVLLAVGFRARTVRRLLLIEHGALLALGLGIGVVASAVAVLPAMLSPSAQLPFRSLVVTLLAVVANGGLWTWVATRLALRGNLLSALRNE